MNTREVWFIVGSVWMVGSILKEDFWMSILMFAMGAAAIICMFATRGR